MAEVIPTAGTASADFYSREIRMPVSGYMDFHVNKPQDEPGTADFHRFVLLFGHSFSNRIQFWSELELEHAFVEGAEESGELELEQAYLDFLLKPWFNLRSGIVLTPMGLINERHEPPSFNGVERPFVDTLILPTTWFGPGVGVHGDLGNGLTYKLYAMDALDSSLFSAEEGFRGGRRKAFKPPIQNAAFTGRLEYHGLPGLSLGAGFWTGKTGFATPGINPRGEHLRVRRTRQRRPLRLPRRVRADRHGPHRGVERAGAADGGRQSQSGRAHARLLPGGRLSSAAAAQPP